MPIVRKLTAEEVAVVENKRKSLRKTTEEQYDQILADFSIGDYGEVIPDAGEKRLTVRNRLAAAAERRSVKVAFSRTRGEAIRFRVIAADEDSASAEAAVAQSEPELEPVSSEAPPAPKRRGGRPKAQVA